MFSALFFAAGAPPRCSYKNNLDPHPCRSRALMRLGLPHPSRLFGFSQGFFVSTYQTARESPPPNFLTVWCLCPTCPVTSDDENAHGPSPYQCGPIHTYRTSVKFGHQRKLSGQVSRIFPSDVGDSAMAPLPKPGSSCDLPMQAITAEPSATHIVPILSTPVAPS
jgi:hypothetical protein